jgi:outer membrane biosynthesis protein TonB
MAAHVMGDVLVTVIVGQAGETQRGAPASGPAMLQSAAVDAAKQWTFKPLMVGARAVPYAVQLKLMFRSNGPQNSTVFMEP